MPATKTKNAPPSKSRREGETTLEYIKRQHAERPDDPNGSEPYRDNPSTSYKRRSSRPYFIGAPGYPGGIMVGGSELYMEDGEGNLRLFSFRADVSSEELDILECELHGRRHITPRERAMQRELRDKRAVEIKHYGRAVDTATSEEQLVSALAQVGDPNLRKLMLKAALEGMEKGESK